MCKISILNYKNTIRNCDKTNRTSFFFSDLFKYLLGNSPHHRELK